MTEYGISLLPDTSPDDRSPREYWDDMLAIAGITEDLGLEYVKMTEHYMSAYGGYCPDPLAYLSAVAARTSRVRLMTGGVQASFHHPIQIAARAAQLDAISNGRLDIGFARAFLPYEFDAFGIDMDSSKDRFRETIDAVVRLWTQPTDSVHSAFFDYADVASYPPVTQSPHPPVWAAALLTRSSFEWIGDSAFNLLIASAPSREQVGQLREMIELYRERFSASPAARGRKPKVAVSVALYLADTDEEAHRLGQPLLRKHWDVFGAAADSWDNRESSSYVGYREAVTTKHRSGPSEKAGLSVFGSPESAVEQIAEIRDALTPDIMLWQLDFGAQPLESMQRSLELFAHKVRPALAETERA